MIKAPVNPAKAAEYKLAAKNTPLQPGLIRTTSLRDYSWADRSPTTAIETLGAAIQCLPNSQRWRVEVVVGSKRTTFIGTPANCIVWLNGPCS